MEIKEKENTEIDLDIIKYINENEYKHFNSIIENDSRVEIMLALSRARKNIISWYPFEKDCTILEIGADYGQITKTLCRNARKVISYEKNKERREAILKRHKDLKNLTVIENLENLNEQFDYITLIGLEDITSNIQNVFEETKKLLKADGKLLIAMDNKYSVKNFSTKDRIEKLLNNNNKMTTLDKVIEQLKNATFSNYKVYYPLTDYKFTNVIFTEDEKISKNELSRNIIYNNQENIKFFEENELLNKLIEDKIELKYFVNSFFIEVFNGEYIDNEIRLVAFSNMRKNEYKIKTIMKKDFVYKYADNKESENHIKNVKKNIDIMRKSSLKTIDSYDNEKIISKYVENDTFDKVIIKAVKNDKNEAIELIKKYKQQLVDNLECETMKKNVFDKYCIEYDEETIEQMKFTKYGLWDLIFQNCFYIDNDFYFYDQEWMEENIPIDFILYRAIKYFIQIRKYISIDELYEILDINEEKIKLFEELDNKIQENSRNNMVWQRQKNGKTVEEMRIQKLTDNHTINLLNIEIANKTKLIEELSIEIENKNKQIEELNLLNDELENKNRQIEELENRNKEIEVLETEIQENNQKINKLASELRIIKNSKSWRFMTTLKKIIGKK